jgi:hypothetical protein
MPASFLFTFLFALGAVSFGLAAFFYAWHIPLPMWLRPPYVQKAYEKLPAWRRKIMHVLPRVGAIVNVIVAVACAIIAAYLAFATTRAAGAYQATPEDITIVEIFAVFLIAFQLFLLTMLSIQLWRSRRSLRKLALRSGLSPQAFAPPASPSPEARG